MSKRLEIEKYGLQSYDDYLCLRPPLLLLICVVLLCRGLVAFVGFGMAGVPAGLRDFVRAETLYLGALAAAPAALVCYALLARAPAAPAFVRSIWRHGRSLLSLSALSYIAVAAAELGPDPRRWLGVSSVAVKAVALVELAIVAYLFASPRVRQVFLDFPST